MVNKLWAFSPIALQVLTTAGALSVTVLLLPAQAQAIPAFARDYQVPCSTCHILVTRRNEFGDAFRRAGYHWPTTNAAEDGAAGAPPVEMRGITPFEGALPAIPALGIVTTFSASATNDPGSAHVVSPGTPSFQLVFGGSLGRHLSALGIWSGRGTPTELSVHLARLRGPALNLKLGVFEQTTTLFKINEGLLGGYLLGTSALNGHALSQSRIGIEANGVLGQRTFWALGIAQNGAVGTPYNYYYHLSQRVCGTSFRGQEPEVDLEHPTFWEDVTLTLGHWGYFGDVQTEGGLRLSRVRRAGLDLQLRVHKLSFWSGLMLGRDHLVAPDAAAGSVTGFAELGYFLRPWLMALYLYQYQDAATLMREVQQHTVGMVAGVLENMRVRLDLGYSADGAKNDSLNLQLLVGF